VRQVDVEWLERAETSPCEPLLSCVRAGCCQWWV